MAWASAQITSPKEHFGFNIGDDYHLANFTQTLAYFKTLSEQSDRIKYTSIGLTEEGREQPMLIVSSAENLSKLDRYKQISQQLARAELTEEQAKALAQEGKSVVWIDGGLHANETVGMHQLIQMAYQLASAQDAETLNILNNTIVLLTHANPDGQELISNWYMREPVAQNRSLSLIPKLYQKYAGHDNNRDFFMLNLKESQNIARQLFIEWNPQIMYNHHQTAPAGAVVAGAPYRDPFNYVFDPLVISGIEALGAAMSSRLYAENKPGYTQRGGSVFSTWYNGGLRTTTYFHNTIGLLTEIIGGPNPFDIPLVSSRLLPSSDTHFPVMPQTWHFKQSIDYSISLNYAVLNYAAKFNQEVLYNIYKMGRNSIEKGKKNHTTLSPSKIAVIDKATENLRKNNTELAKARYAPSSALDSLLTNPNYRDPRGYIISAENENMATTIRFLNALSANGIQIKQAKATFSHAGKTYPEGSFIITTDQAFRPHILDMFEAQDHPNDFQYPGGPPIAPYDAAGWTLAYLMHIDFDRAYQEINAQYTTFELGEQITPINTAIPNSKYIGLSIKENETFKMVNTLLKTGKKVYRLPSGDFITPNNTAPKELLENAGIKLQAISNIPASAQLVKKLKIGLWDRYGGSMSSGWLRYIMDQYGYDYSVIFAPDIEKGNLNKQYDIIILSNDATFRNSANLDPEILKTIPSPYKEQYGNLSPQTSFPEIEKFVQQGGHLLTIGRSANIVELFNLDVENHLMKDGKILTRAEFYTPGSILTASVDNQSTSALGYNKQMDIYFNNNNIYKIKDSSIKPILWFSLDKPLKSGWSWGEQYLKDGVIAFQKDINKGKITVFTPDITFRAQSHGTFKLLLNNLY